MATEKQPKKKSKLGEEPYLSMFAETRRLASEALKKYRGEPTMTREELRKLAAKELKGKSLGDYIIEERKSGF